MIKASVAQSVANDALQSEDREWLPDEDLQRLIRHRIRTLARRHGKGRYDLEALSQEFLLHAWISLKRFDRRRSNRTTYLSAVLDNSIRGKYRAGAVRKRNARNPIRSIHNGSLEEAIEHDARRNRISSENRLVELRQDLDRAQSELSTRQQVICSLLASDHSQSSVARRLTISRRQVRNEMVAIRRKFESKGLADFL